MTLKEALFPERLPKEVWKDLRKELLIINDPDGFAHEKNAEACAFRIQRLQKEFQMSKDFHIGLAPEPGKLLLV